MINKSGQEKKQPKSPLKHLYNIEKTLFPDMKINIDDFEKILAEIYSKKKTNV